MAVYIVKSEKQGANRTPAFNSIKLNEQGFPIIPGTGDIRKESKITVSKKQSGRLKGYVDDPNSTHRNYGNKGIIEKYFGIPYAILRKISREFTVVASILKLRSLQIHPFAEIWHDDDKPGIKVVLKDRHAEPTEKQRKVMQELEEWVYQTGNRDFDLSVKRKDRLPQFYEKLVRDVLTIDRVAITRRVDYTGEVVDFAILDGATIKPVDPYVGFEGDQEIEYVQDINGTIVEQYKAIEVIIDWMYQTSDVEHQYHGWSTLEESFKEIKHTIQALKYNSGNFSDNKAPKGFFVLPENVTESQLDELEERWNALFTGVESAFRTPFFAGNEKISYQSVGATNRDMEYDKYMQLLLLLLFANFSVDPAELGMKLDRGQQLFGEMNEGKKQDKSKDRGLGALLDFGCRILNRVVEGSKKWEPYKIIHTGRQNIDKEAKLESDTKKLANYVTLGEIRKENDRPSLVDLAKESGIDDEEYLELLKKDEMLIFNAQYSTMRNQSAEGEEEGFEDENAEEEEAEDEDGGLESHFDDEVEEDAEDETEDEDDEEESDGAIDLIQKSKQDSEMIWVELDD